MGRHLGYAFRILYEDGQSISHATNNIEYLFLIIQQEGILGEHLVFCIKSASLYPIYHTELYIVFTYNYNIHS